MLHMECVTVFWISIYTALSLELHSEKSATCVHFVYFNLGSWLSIDPHFNSISNCEQSFYICVKWDKVHINGYNIFRKMAH